MTTGSLDDARSKGHEVLLSVDRLNVEFSTRRRTVHAVRDASFDIAAGESLGVIGESGSGKSVTALSILRLTPAGAEVTADAVTFDGRDVMTMSKAELRELRGRQVGIVFQDPATCLNPAFRVGAQIDEVLRLRTDLDTRGRRARAIALLEQFAISAPEDRLASFPHELSGGTRQRVAAAIALAGSPALLIADEPTTALDATAQAAYLEVLANVRAETGLAILFVSHDFGAVARVCDRVVVMYAGRVVEEAPTAELLTGAAHPYSISLVRSATEIWERPARLYTVPAGSSDNECGCPFASRCPVVEDRCHEEFPPDLELKAGHVVRCWHHV